MSAITSRLPSRLPSRRIAGVNVMNLVLGAALVAAGVGAYLLVGQSATSTSVTRTATVARGVVLSTVSATGTLQPPKQLSVGFTSSGQLVSVAVKAGQQVKAGQVLGRIDATTARQALTQAETSLRSAQAQLAQTLAGETAQQRAQDALSVEQAKQSLANAKASLASTKTSIALDKRTSAASVAQAQKQLRVDQGQLQVDLAKLKADSTVYANADAAAAAVAADKQKLAADQATQQAHQATQLDAQNQQANDQALLKAAQTANDGALISRYTTATSEDAQTLQTIAKQLQTDGFTISNDQTQLSNDQAAQTALTSDQTAIKNDEQKIAQDNDAIESAKTNQRSTALKDVQSLRAAQQQVASAQLSVRSTLAGIAVKQAPPTPSALASAQGAVVQARIALENARRTLAQTTLRAPIAGVVAAVNGTVGAQTSGGGTSLASTSSSSSSAASSASSSSSSGFVTLTDVKGMQVVAGFSETDAAKLQVGQAATVTVDALPSKQLAAHVIAVAATSTTSSSVVTYNVTFAIDRSVAQLKPGMTANVDVVTSEQDNVLHVPTAAVTGTGSNASVTVLRNGQQVRVPVVAGLQGDSATAILGGGLKVGDTVVLPSVSISSSSSSGSSIFGSGTSTTGSTGGTTRRFNGGGFGGGFGG